MIATAVYIALLSTSDFSETTRSRQEIVLQNIGVKPIYVVSFFLKKKKAVLHIPANE